MVDDLFGLLESGNAIQKLVDFAIGIILFEAFSEFFEFSNLSEKVIDVGVELTGHTRH